MVAEGGAVGVMRLSKAREVVGAYLPLGRPGRSAMAGALVLLCIAVGSLARDVAPGRELGRGMQSGGGSGAEESEDMVMADEGAVEMEAEPMMMKRTMAKPAMMARTKRSAVNMASAQGFAEAKYAAMDDGAEGGMDGATDALPEQRLIVKNGNLVLRAENVSVARAAIVAEATRIKGFVASENTHAQHVPKFYPRRRPGPDHHHHDPPEDEPPSPPPQEHVNLDLRIPSEHFDDFLTFARSTASAVLSSSVSGQDVTEQYVDATARAKNLESAHARLLALMDRANEVRDVLNVQRELTRVTGDLEAQKGRAASLQKRAALSSLHVSLSPPDPRPEPPPPRKPVPRLHVAFRKAFGLLAETGLRALDGAVYLVVLGVPAAALAGIAMCVARARASSSPAKV